ncbi:hemagglutinin repeat-containing protein, partial [Sporomusa acidovorans]
TIGTQSTKTTLNEQVKDEIGSTVGSIAGNVTITAGNNVKNEGTTVVSGKDTNITGKNVSIDNTINTYDSQYKYEFKQNGLSVSLGGGVVDTGTDLVGSLNRAGEVQDNRLKALYINKAKDDLKAIGKDFKQDPNGGVSINIGIGSTKITSEQNTHIETVNMSNVTAGGDVTIKATAGDVNLKATNINATNVTVGAQQNINIESAQNKQQTRTNTKSSSSSIGASFGLSGSFGGFTGGTGSNKGKENEDINTHTESVINAGGTTTLKSGNDTNIIGSQVKGEKVVTDVGGNLNIASKQDTDNYTANSKSSGISFITGDKNGKDGRPGTDKKKLSDNGVIGSNNKAKTNSTYSSVIEQAGIYAGKDGFDIQVGKNTDLKGSVISSEATPDKNKISTDTLTYSDIQNKADYSASSVGVNYDSRKYSPSDT